VRQYAQDQRFEKFSRVSFGPRRAKAPKALEAFEGLKRESGISLGSLKTYNAGIRIMRERDEKLRNHLDSMTIE
jgi:hypothetical protein